VGNIHKRKEETRGTNQEEDTSIEEKWALIGQWIEKKSIQRLAGIVGDPMGPMT